MYCVQNIAEKMQYLVKMLERMCEQAKGKNYDQGYQERRQLSRLQ